ncbi:MAG: heme lyase CcmF/NrfE family subunit [Anaerolineae bacterium]
MFADLGNSAIYLALAATLYSIGAMGFAQWGPRLASETRTKLVSSGRNAAIAVFPLLVLACIIMILALINNDFSIDYVRQVTSRATPFQFKFSALWGGQAGSLLLWNVFLAGFLAAAWLSKNEERDLIPYAIIIGGLTQAYFLYLSAFPENPFAPAVSVALDGNGLSPLLRHPLMIIHPPMLYLGYTGFVVPFSFAMAALLAGRLDDSWIRTTRRWTLTAWLFLSLGLILGGRWAYDVLGWGGYWEWDPVENVAFLPWLTATAFLHSVMIQEKRGMFKVWNIVLILTTYLTVLYGTFIVRTGLLSSVHAFAQSDIQWGFFAFVGSMFLFSVGVAIWRAPELRSENYLESLLSREAAFLANNFLILAITIIIFLFTNFALLSEWITCSALFGGRWDCQSYGVGPDTYNIAVGPLFAAVLLLMGIAPMTMWYKTSINRLGKQSMWPAVVATVFAAGLVLGGMRQIGAIIGLWIVAFSMLLTLLEYVRGAQARVNSKKESWPVALGKLFQRNQRRYGGYLIHLGVLVMAAGIIGTEFFQMDRQVFLNVGERASLGDYTIEYLGTTFSENEDTAMAMGTVAVYDGSGTFLTNLQPHTDIFDNGQGMTIPDARSTIAEDFYVILVNWENITETSATIRMYLNPLIQWVWFGGVIFIVGTLVAAWPDPLDEKIAAAERRVALATVNNR